MCSVLSLGLCSLSQVCCVVCAVCDVEGIGYDQYECMMCVLRGLWMYVCGTQCVCVLADDTCVFLCVVGLGTDRDPKP